MPDQAAADVLRTLVIVPTYNEKENVARLLRCILDQGKSIEALVVDDASPDGTADIVRGMQTDDARISLLCRAGKLGLGTAHIAGFRWALARDYERIITMDADFSHPPDAIPAMLECSRRCEIVLGSRYIEGGGYKGWPAHRILLSATANLVARVGLGLKPRDVTGAYRCFHRDVLSRIAFDNVISRGYSFQEEMLWHCSDRGWRIGEVPILFVDRQEGTSKINLQEIWGAVATIGRLMFTPFSRKLRVTVENGGDCR